MKNQERPTGQAAQPADETEVVKTDIELAADTETQTERAEAGVGVETKHARRQAKRKLGEAVLATEQESKETPAAVESAEPAILSALTAGRVGAQPGALPRERAAL